MDFHEILEKALAPHTQASTGQYSGIKFGVNKPKASTQPNSASAKITAQNQRDVKRLSTPGEYMQRQRDRVNEMRNQTMPKKRFNNLNYCYQ